MISEQKKVEHPTWDSNLEGTLPYWWICRRNFSRGWWSCQSDSGNLYSSQVGGKRDADNKTQWSYLLRYFNHSIVHLFFSSVKRSFNNYVDRKRGEGVSKKSTLGHVTKGRYHVKFNNCPLEGGGRQICTIFDPRSCWMTPKNQAFSLPKQSVSQVSQQLRIANQHP